MFADIGREFRSASLGDRRRSARLEAIGTRLAGDPSRTFPEAMASEGQLEALYRFLNNDGVTFGRILRPHTVMTVERCAEHRDVLVLHDATSMEFAGERHGLGRLETSARTGFFLHVGLAVTASRQPLGVLAAETWVRRAPRLALRVGKQLVGRDHFVPLPRRERDVERAALDVDDGVELG